MIFNLCIELCMYTFLPRSVHYQYPRSEFNDFLKFELAAACAVKTTQPWDKSQLVLTWEHNWITTLALTTLSFCRSGRYDAVQACRCNWRHSGHENIPRLDILTPSQDDNHETSSSIKSAVNVTACSFSRHHRLILTDYLNRIICLTFSPFKIKMETSVKETLVFYS